MNTCKDTARRSTHSNASVDSLRRDERLANVEFILDTLLKSRYGNDVDPVHLPYVSCDADLGLPIFSDDEIGNISVRYQSELWANSQGTVRDLITLARRASEKIMFQGTISADLSSLNPTLPFARGSPGSVGVFHLSTT